jgi:hypothetical protein
VAEQGKGFGDNRGLITMGGTITDHHVYHDALHALFQGGTSLSRRPGMTFGEIGSSAPVSFPNPFPRLTMTRITQILLLLRIHVELLH